MELSQGAKSVLGHTGGSSFHKCGGCHCGGLLMSTLGAQGDGSP